MVGNSEQSSRPTPSHYGLLQKNGISEVLVSFRDMRFIAFNVPSRLKTMFNECIAAQTAKSDLAGLALRDNFENLPVLREISLIKSRCVSYVLMPANEQNVQDHGLRRRQNTTTPNEPNGRRRPKIGSLASAKRYYRDSFHSLR
jgi:hypothetical protein